MTGPDESYSSTRPISVAELLAKNGTIGAPPVGGRRRRRRGNTDAVSVAELTGEIPIVTGDTHKDTSHGTADPATDQLDEVSDDYPRAVPGNGTRSYAGAARVADDFRDAPTDDASLTDEEADYAAHLEEREAEPMFFEPPARRPQYGGLGPKRYPGGVGAEEMSPDPLDVDDNSGDIAGSGLTRPSMAAATAPDTDADELPSYLRSSGASLFDDDPVSEGFTRRGRASLDDLEFGATDIDHDDDVDMDSDMDMDMDMDMDVDVDVEDLDDEDLDDDQTTMSPVAHGALVVGQCILAVLFGAGLFIGFDQLWKWNNIVALVLSVLVILGLVVGVRVVRKTEDIGSTLIAVAVGALVTLGPLALLQSG